MKRGLGLLVEPIGLLSRRFRHRSAAVTVVGPRVKYDKRVAAAKFSAPTRAIEYFDRFYLEIFGDDWESIRAGLLADQKYCAVINNYGDNIQNAAELELLDCFNMRERMFELHGDKPKSLAKENTSVGEVRRGMTIPEIPQYNEELSLDEDLDRVIIPSKGQDVASLQSFLPATKIKGLEGAAEPIDELSYLRQCQDFEVNVVKGQGCEFPKLLDVYSRVSGEEEELPESTQGSLGTSGYYCMDAASVLPVLALNLQPGDSVLDLCSAPGGKMLIMLQTMYPSMVVANDASMARVNRIKCVVREFLGDMKNQWGDRLVMSWSRAEAWSDFDRFDKVLADVPCQNDRRSLVNEDNNIFHQKRVRERVSLPELQSNILISAIRACKVGGTAVYSTCTLSPIQNDGVVHMSLKRLEEDHNIICHVEDLSIMAEQFSFMFKFASDTISPRFGQLVLPNVNNNFGPMYFSRIKRIT